MAEDAQAPKTEFQNKLEEQAAAKGGLSYSYFAAGRGTTAAPPPKPLTPRAAEAAAAAASKAGGGSAWNAAGTYEERDVSAWARARVEALLKGEEQEKAVELVSAAATGEAHVFFVRGRRRAAFELDVSLVWRSASAADEGVIRGTAKATNVTGDDVDDEDDVDVVVALDGDGGADAAAAKAAQKAARQELRALLCERLRQLRQEMRDGLAT